ncbi:MAG: winged helix-turn-helix domain-containing protein [Opitutaceae bacterium]|jgi:DNA-binding GntR family transcriptional regulator|nr:winged helix-turn-helix domain-containing protein [Opitutaceae bacterium]
MPATAASLLPALVLPSLPELPPRQQVDTLIRGWIASGEYAPGDMIPTARDIARLCNDVRGPTVRRAIKTLIAEGLLRGVRGKGVYVHMKPAKL